MPLQEYFVLEGGDRMPRIGFGTWQVSIYLIPFCFKYFPEFIKLGSRQRK